jgi:hypothetical protein
MGLSKSFVFAAALAFLAALSLLRVDAQIANTTTLPKGWNAAACPAFKAGACTFARCYQPSVGYLYKFRVRFRLLTPNPASPVVPRPRALVSARFLTRNARIAFLFVCCDVLCCDVFCCVPSCRVVSCRVTFDVFVHLASVFPRSQVSHRFLASILFVLFQSFKQGNKVTEVVNVTGGTAAEIGGHSINVKSPGDCCWKCAVTPQCVHWQWIPYLKK